MLTHVTADTTDGTHAMSNCTTGCPTKDCPSYSACLRGKAPRVAYCDSGSGRDYTAQKTWDKNLTAYQDARRQGVQPSGTDRPAVERAMAMSNEVGKAWSAS